MATAISNPGIPAVPRHLRKYRYLNISFVAKLTNYDGWSMEHCASFPIDQDDWNSWVSHANRALNALCSGNVKHATLVRWLDWSKA